MCDEICKTCGGDNETAEIGRRLGFRPDIAFREVRKLERELEDTKAELKETKAELKKYKDKASFDNAWDGY